jgi:5-hydroxyisourate hydrolase
VTESGAHAGPTISTHVLDAERGQPAVGVHVTLYRLGEDGRPVRLTQALTDGDGRVRDLLERPLVAGDYRLEFTLARERPDLPGGDPDDDGANAAGVSAEGDRFFRRMSVDLRITDTGRSYHIPLLLAPFSMTTYRGS